MRAHAPHACTSPACTRSRRLQGRRVLDWALLADGGVPPTCQAPFRRPLSRLARSRSRIERRTPARARQPEHRALSAAPGQAPATGRRLAGPSRAHAAPAWRRRLRRASSTTRGLPSQLLAGLCGSGSVRPVGGARRARSGGGTRPARAGCRRRSSTAAPAMNAKLMSRSLCCGRDRAADVAVRVVERRGVGGAEEAPAAGRGDAPQRGRIRRHVDGLAGFLDGAAGGAERDGVDAHAGRLGRLAAASGLRLPSVLLPSEMTTIARPLTWLCEAFREASGAVDRGAERGAAAQREALERAA